MQYGCLGTGQPAVRRGKERGCRSDLSSVAVALVLPASKSLSLRVPSNMFSQAMPGSVFLCHFVSFSERNMIADKCRKQKPQTETQATRRFGSLAFRCKIVYHQSCEEVSDSQLPGRSVCISGLFSPAGEVAFRLLVAGSNRAFEMCAKLRKVHHKSIDSHRCWATELDQKRRFIGINSASGLCQNSPPFSPCTDMRCLLQGGW